MTKECKKRDIFWCFNWWTKNWKRGERRKIIWLTSRDMLFKISPHDFLSFNGVETVLIDYSWWQKNAKKETFFDVLIGEQRTEKEVRGGTSLIHSKIFLKIFSVFSRNSLKPSEKYCWLTSRDMLFKISPHDFLSFNGVETVLIDYSKPWPFSTTLSNLVLRAPSSHFVALRWKCQINVCVVNKTRVFVLRFKSVIPPFFFLPRLEEGLSPTPDFPCAVLKKSRFLFP